MSTTETKYTLAQLRASKKTLYIRNNTELPWRLSSLSIELKALGQPGSIAFVPSTALDNVDLVRNIDSGKVTVSPDLEEERAELHAIPKKSVKQSFLEDLKAVVQESPKDRAIDAKDQAEALLDRSVQKRVGQSRLTNDLAEFTRPSPVTFGDKVVDPMTGEILSALQTDVDTGIKSVTVERSRKAEEN